VGVQGGGGAALVRVQRVQLLLGAGGLALAGVQAEQVAQVLRGLARWVGEGDAGLSLLGGWSKEAEEGRPQAYAEQNQETQERAKRSVGAKADRSGEGRSKAGVQAGDITKEGGQALSARPARALACAAK
jgi:hypothetical protein